jgi:hypothetical protein
MPNKFTNSVVVSRATHSTADFILFWSHGSLNLHGCQAATPSTVTLTGLSPTSVKVDILFRKYNKLKVFGPTQSI